MAEDEAVDLCLTDVFEAPFEYGAGLEEVYRRLIGESGIALRETAPLPQR